MSGSVQWTEITSLVDYTICGPQIKLVLDGPCWSVAAGNLKKYQKYQRTVGYPSTSWASCFIPHLHSTPSEYCHKVLLPDREKKSEDMITRFDRNHERDRRTDGQTDTA